MSEFLFDSQEQHNEGPKHQPLSCNTGESQGVFRTRNRNELERKLEVKNVAICSQEVDHDALNLEDLAEILGVGPGSA